MKKLLSVILIVFALVMTKDSFSQITGSINAKGTVLTPISITGTRILDFGNDILPGIVRTIDKTAATSGKFSIAGQPSKQISIDLDVPTNLVNGVNNLPITYSTTDAGYKTPAGTLTAFNPVVITNANFASEGTMDIFIGGKVTPAHNQVAGLYQATISISLAYTGN